MSDSNRTTIRYDPGTNNAGEAAFGVLNATPAMQEIKHVSDSLKADTTISRSRQIVSDRMINDIARTDLAVSGDIGIEMSAGMFDDWLIAVIQAAGASGAFPATGTESDATFDITTPATIARTGGDFTAAPLSLASGGDDWIFLSGYTDPANAGFWKTASVATLAITVETGAAPSGNRELATESATASSTIDAGGAASNGTTKRTYSIEKEFSDISEFELNLGCAVDQLTVNTNVRNIVEGSFTFQGTSQQSGSATFANSTSPAPNNGVWNAVDDVSILLESNGNQLTNRATQFSFTIANNHRPLPVIGTLGAIDVGVGSFNITGRFQAYFENELMMDKYLNFGDGQFSLCFDDGAGNGYVFDFPSVKITSGQRVIPGQDDDVLVDVEWEAFKDANENIMCKIVKFTGLPTS